MIPQPPPVAGPEDLRGPLAPRAVLTSAQQRRAFRVAQAREWANALVGVGLLVAGLAMIGRDLLQGLGWPYAAVGTLFAVGGGYRTYHLGRYLVRER